MHMLHVALVEDIDAEREWLEKKLEAYFHSHHIRYRISPFSSGEAFLAVLKDSWFDIVFMDIYMDGITGVEAAQALRAKDQDCKLVFLTSSEDFMRQAFSLNTAHYLVKPVQDEDFLQAIENCQISKECQVPFLDLPNHKHNVQLSTLDILYIDVQNRITTIHTKTGSLQAGRGFQLVADQLADDKRFLLCNKGLLVNMDFIAAVEDYDFVLVNGERLPIAPRRKKELISHYHNYTFYCLGE